MMQAVSTGGGEFHGKRTVHYTSKYQPIYLIQSKNQQVNRCKIKEERYGVSLMKSDLESNKLVSNTFRMI